MQAYAEGWELMEATDLITDVPAVVKSWQQGTVIRSWLLDLMVRALDEDPHLEQLRGYAQDSGEGRWTVQAAVDHAVPLPVITAALFARFASRQDDSPAMKVIAALRNQFGGHAVTSSAGSTEKGADAPGADVDDRVTLARSGQGRARTAPGESTPAMRVGCPVADRLPVLAAARHRAGAGTDRAGGQQRPGQDQHRRGAALRRDPRLAPGVDRRAAGPAGRGAGDHAGARSSATSARRWSSWSSTRARRTARGSTAAPCREPEKCWGC